jgi:hypothetical protein
MAPELRLLHAASGALVTGIVAATLAVITQQEYQRLLYNYWHSSVRATRAHQAMATLPAGRRKSRGDDL